MPARLNSISVSMRSRPGAPSAAPVTRASSLSLVVSMIEKESSKRLTTQARDARVEHLDMERIVADRDALDARLRRRRDR